ncbi:hypothetical protein FRC15_003601 [Serendipita sp. 397]|nr:hypothetical protein FRC15_003601 [Serendipita sp. 397]
MIKEWDDGLSLMLVFTISHQLSNSSTEPYIWQDKPLDHPRSWTVKVNALFFTSLGCTLIVSLVSVLCLQWIRDFDKGLASITNPQERALKRQFRLEGIKKWHLPTIIGILPTLLVVALILFMAGMVVWLRGISRKVTIISCVILILGGGFYIITGLLAAIFPSAPFNSSSSRLVELTLLAIVHSLKSLYRRHFVSKVSRDEWKLASSIASKDFNFSVGHRQHEDEAIASNLKLPSASLLWLLSHIDVTTGTMQRLEDILDELLHVKGPESMLDSYEKVSNQSSPAFALAWLSELRLLLLQQDVSREFILEVLIELCNAQVPDPLPFFTQDVPVMYFSDVLHHVIMTTIMVLTPTMGRRSLSRAQAQPLDQLFGMLITSYGNSRARSRQYHHQHPKEVDLLMKHLVHAMLMEFANLSTEVQKGAMTQMRRPAIRALVQGNPEPVCGIEGGPESMTTDHHYHYIENGLQALVRGGTRWADEVPICCLGT